METILYRNFTDEMKTEYGELVIRQNTLVVIM